MTSAKEQLGSNRVNYWNAEKRLQLLRYGAQVIRTEFDLTDEEFESQWLADPEHLKRFHQLPEGSASKL
jgi:hypothetical protein